MNDMHPENTEKSLLSPQFDAFCEALEILYIADNASGRLGFGRAWPMAAAHIFGAQLIDFDHHCADDLSVRADLEVAGEERRLALLALAEEIESKSVDKGVLQLDYIEETVRRLGRDLGLLFYDAKIVNRFLPDLAAKVEDEVEGAAQEAVVSDAVPDVVAEEVKAEAEEIVVHETHSFAPAAPEEEVKRVPVISVITDIK